MKHFAASDLPDLLKSMRQPFHDGYWAMYSSVYGGIVTHPALMLVPIDDHMVHRGDGVFEALKVVQGSIYNLEAHLDRLEHSATSLALPLPAPRAALRDIVIETVRAAGRKEATIRIFISRGPGSFGVNPYDSRASQLYVVVGASGRPFMQDHPAGARIRSSGVAPKPASLSHIKNCNYVPNVMMKKEAVDAGVDFSAGFDELGYLTEGAVENMGIVTGDQRLLFPRLERILAGTTMLRVVELARSLIPLGVLKDVATADISRQEILAAPEFILTGTTINVVAGVEFDGHPIGTGKPGPVYAALSQLLQDDMSRNSTRLTPAITSSTVMSAIQPIS